MATLARTQLLPSLVHLSRNALDVGSEVLDPIQQRQAAHDAWVGSLLLCEELKSQRVELRRLQQSLRQDPNNVRLRNAVLNQSRLVGQTIDRIHSMTGEDRQAILERCKQGQAAPPLLGRQDAFAPPRDQFPPGPFDGEF